MVETPPRRRRDIEEVASTLFRERGYAATGVRDIARALDLQGASLYAHVTSKEDVLWAIVDRAARRFEAAAELALDPRDRPSPVERLAALVSGHIRVVTDDVGEAAVFVAEWRSLSPARRAAVLARRDAYEARLRDLIAEGMADGAFTLTDPGLAATFVLTALNGIATWYRPDGRLTPDRIADHYTDLVLRALSADTP